MNLQICYFHKQHDTVGYSFLHAVPPSLSHPPLKKTKVHTFWLVPVSKATSLILREGGRFRSGQRKGSVCVKSAGEKKYRNECRAAKERKGC